MAAVTVHNNFGTQEKKVSLFPLFICHEAMGSDIITLVFWMLSCQPAFSLSVSSSSKVLLILLNLLPWWWCYLRIWGYWYFSWQSWFQIVLHSLAFHMMYSAYKINKQDDNLQPWRSPFPIWNQSIVPFLVLTVAFWPVYRFLRKQVMSDDFSDGRLGCEHPEEQEQILLISVFLNTWQGLYVLQISTK